MERKRTRLIYTGVINFSLRLSTAPLSFIFTYLVAHYLSNLPDGRVIFATWQSIFVLVMGYFTIPSDIFSLITSRFASEDKPVGGIIIVNAIAGVISALVYSLIVPYLMETITYIDPLAFYSATLLIITFYVYKIVTAITRGRTPLVIGITATVFQISRLVIVLVAFFLFRLTIIGVIIAYSIGYIIQTILSLRYVKANLTIDFSVSKKIIKKSIVTIIYYLQLIMEATIVWLTLIITHDPITISYFESALIISNIVTWSYSIYDGLIAKLSESKSADVVETAVKLYFTISTLFLSIVLVESYPLLYHLRRDYTQALMAFIVLSVSNYLRGIYSIFYYSVIMKDKAMGFEEDNLKGYTAKLNISNIQFAVIGVIVSLILVYLFKWESAYILATLMTLGILINSVWMSLSSYRVSKDLYSFKFPVKESLTSVLIGLITILLLFRFSIMNVSYMFMLIEGGLVILVYASLSYFLNPFAKRIIKEGIKEVRKTLM